MTEMCPLRVTGVSKSYGTLKALVDVDWQVPAAGIHGLVGPNGAGKTTLFSIACGFLPADRGSVAIHGQAVSPAQPPRPGGLGILPQDAMLPERQNIGPTLRHYGQLAGLAAMEAEEEMRRVLKLVGLADVAGRRPGTLSHGMFKRVGIAQALIGSPPLVLLDEPTAGLDPNVARDIRSLLREIRTEGAIVVSSHNLAEIEDLCSGVTILNEGRVVRQDSVAALVGEAEEVSFRLTGEPELGLIEAIRAVDVVSEVRWDPTTDRLRVRVRADGGGAAAATAPLVQAFHDQGCQFLDMHVGARLEDRFAEETR